MRVAVVASSHWFEAVNDEGRPDLAPAFAALRQSSPRRIDRFVRLALLGAGRCVGDRKLPAELGLCLGSATGAMASTAMVQQQMLRDGLLPRPVDFVNTLGGTAGFHMANMLQTHGFYQFVSQQHGQFMGAATVAMTALAGGMAPAVLVGCVEDVAGPVAWQRHRLGLAEDTVLAEGSHWLLLEKRAAGADEAELELSRWHDVPRLMRQLVDCHEVRLLASIPANVSAQISDTLGPRLPPTETSPFHGSLDAAWMTGRLAEGLIGPLALVGRSHVLRLGGAGNREQGIGSRE